MNGTSWRDLLITGWECRVTAKAKRLRWSFILLYEFGKLTMYSDEWTSIAQETCKIKNFVPSTVRWQLITFPVSAERWRQQTDQLGRYAHHFPLYWPSILARRKLNVYFIGLQREKLKAINCEFSEKYWELMLFLCAMICVPDDFTYFQDDKNGKLSRRFILNKTTTT